MQGGAGSGVGCCLCDTCLHLVGESGRETCALAVRDGDYIEYACLGCAEGEGCLGCDRYAPREGGEAR